uniref:Uncharacterized protein n=1 Tax=Romanomermis culicivorax TaxID=13658 RepID=A0A915JQD5_ROMCU
MSVWKDSHLKLSDHNWGKNRENRRQNTRSRRQSNRIDSERFEKNHLSPPLRNPPIPCSTVDERLATAEPCTGKQGSCRKYRCRQRRQLHIPWKWASFDQTFDRWLTRSY